MNICSLNEARAAKAKALIFSPKIAPIPGVGSTRIGQGYCLKVNLKCDPGREARVPARLEIVGAITKPAGVGNGCPFPLNESGRRA